MRPVTQIDLALAACALACAGVDRQAELARALISKADLADRFRLETGRLHPEWGDGTLAHVARLHPRVAEPFLDDPEYRRCVRLVLDALDRVSLRRN